MSAQAACGEGETGKIWNLLAAPRICPQTLSELAMKKLVLLLAAVLAFTGGRGAARTPGVPAAARRVSFGSILSILLAPRWLRVPLLLRTLAGGRHRRSR